MQDQASGVGTGAAQPATGLVKAWGAGMTAIVAPELLPSSVGAATVAGGGLIGGGSNLANQIAQGGPVSATDVLIATGTGALSKGIGGTIAPIVISGGGAYLGARLQNQDPTIAVAGSAIGSVTGGLASKTFESINRVKPIVQGNAASVISDITGAATAEAANSKFQRSVNHNGATDGNKQSGN